MRAPTFILACCALTVLPLRAHADIDPLSGIDFVNITHSGNAPWSGDGTMPDRAIGRGAVDHEFSIGRFEVNTAQWVEFMNSAFDRPAGDSIPHVFAPTFWGATSTAPLNSGNPDARRWTVPTGNDMRAVGNITWRTAAIYCNWLCNGKGVDQSAFMNGAYDVTTFGFEPSQFGDRFTDQFTHTPGAAYYIPSWDEWMKAAHYDPNKLNSDGSTGGWWSYSNGTDQPWIGAPPSQGGTANFGFGGSGQPNPFVIPLGAYSGTSPWGLFDIAGATTEWTESVLTSDIGLRYRINDGSPWNSSPGFSIAYATYTEGGDVLPNIASPSYGLRLAHTVPSPGTLVLLALSAVSKRRRRLPRHMTRLSHSFLGSSRPIDMIACH